MITYSFSLKPKFFNTEFKNRILLTVKNILHNHSFKLNRLHYNFCNDDELLTLNQWSLQHDYYTDIITFNYSEGFFLEAEVFISLERVKENSITYQVDYKHELLRVMFHGILHCIGYDDHNEMDKSKMVEQEDFYIQYFYNLENVPRGTYQKSINI